MKKLNIFLSALAALAAVSSCVEEKYQPGEPDVEGCYGVCFPAQEASGSHIYEPEDPTSVTFTVRRAINEGDIVVPLTITASQENIFEVGDLMFEDGQTETTLTVNFPQAEEGVEYSLSLTIDDPQYASKYSESPVSVDFSVLRVKMLEYTNPLGEKAVVTFYEDYWGTWWNYGGEHDAYIKYYEVNGIRYCTAIAVDEDEGIWGSGPSEFSFTWDTATNRLTVPMNAMNFYEDPADDGYGWYYACDWYSINVFFGDWTGSAADYYSDSDTDGQPSYFDPVTGIFYFDLVYPTSASNYNYWVPDNSYDVQVWVDGYVRVDYSVKVQADFTSNGSVPMTFSLGADVASVKYAVFDGSLTAGQLAVAISGILDGSEDSEELQMDGENRGYTINVTPEGESGVYTLVALTFDENGDQQGSTSEVFTFVASGSESKYAVILSCGIGSAEKYRDANTDNTLEIYAYGDDITEVKIGVYSASDYSDYYEKHCLRSLGQMDPVDVDVIDAINGEGYSALVSNLRPGTEYYLLVYASNGYSEEVFASPFSFSTTGEPLAPLNMDFSYSDYHFAFEPESEDDFYGEWNLYAVDLDGETYERGYIGKANIADSEKEDALTPDKNGFTYKYVTIEGLSGYYKDDVVIEDAVNFALCNDGNLYIAENNTVDGNWIVNNLYYYDDPKWGGWYGWKMPYYAGFIPVMDGYYAYIDFGWGGGYVYNGIGYYKKEDGKEKEYAMFVDYLLVDPSKDENGSDPGASARLRQNIDSAVRSAMASAGRQVSGSMPRLSAKQASGSYASFRTVETLREPKAVSFSASQAEMPARQSRPVQRQSASGPARR